MGGRLLIWGIEFDDDDELVSYVYESFCMEYEPEFDTFAFDEQCDDSLHASPSCMLHLSPPLILGGST